MEGAFPEPPPRGDRGAAQIPLALGARPRRELPGAECGRGGTREGTWGEGVAEQRSREEGKAEMCTAGKRGYKDVREQPPCGLRRSPHRQRWDVPFPVWSHSLQAPVLWRPQDVGLEIETPTGPLGASVHVGPREEKKVPWHLPGSPWKIAPGKFPASGISGWVWSSPVHSSPPSCPVLCLPRARLEELGEKTFRKKIDSSVHFYFCRETGQN